MIRVAAILVVAILAAPAAAGAELPPFELARKALKQTRAQIEGRVALQVTLTDDVVRELRGATRWQADGTMELKPDGTDADGAVKLEAGAAPPLHLVWVAVFAADPVAALRRYGGIASKSTRVAVQDNAFVYAWGTSPRVRFFRDMKRLAGFTIRHDGKTWEATLSYDDAEDVVPSRVRVTEGGRPRAMVRVKWSGK